MNNGTYYYDLNLNEYSKIKENEYKGEGYIILREWRKWNDSVQKIVS